MIIRMDVHIPQSGHQITAPEIDLQGIAGVDLVAVVTNFADAAILDKDRCPLNRLRMNAVDQRCVGQERAHERPRERTNQQAAVAARIQANGKESIRGWPAASRYRRLLA